MSPRDAILAAVRKNLPQPAVPLPEIPGFERKGVKHGLGYKEHFTRLPEVPGAARRERAAAPLLPTAVGGDGRKVVRGCRRRRCPGQGGGAIPRRQAWSARQCPKCRARGEIEDVRDPHELNDVDVGVVRSPLGVAETGAVWLTQSELVVNALAVLSQHLVVLLDPAAVVETMHDAYEQIDIAASPYGVFLAGPSATGDIEGVIIHGAQGARSLTVLLHQSSGRHDSREGARS